MGHINKQAYTTKLALKKSTNKPGHTYSNQRKIPRQRTRDSHVVKFNRETQAMFCARFSGYAYTNGIPQGRATAQPDLCYGGSCSPRCRLVLHGHVRDYPASDATFTAIKPHRTKISDGQQEPAFSLYLAVSTAPPECIGGNSLAFFLTSIMIGCYNLTPFLGFNTCSRHPCWYLDAKLRTLNWKKICCNRNSRGTQARVKELTEGIITGIFLSYQTAETDTWEDPSLMNIIDF